MRGSTQGATGDKGQQFDLVGGDDSRPGGDDSIRLEDGAQATVFALHVALELLEELREG